jgi:hypothetical protein
VSVGTGPFSLQHVSPTLAEQVRSSVWDRAPEALGPLRPAATPSGRARRRPVGAFEPAAGLAMTLAGGAFMAVLAVPAYLGAVIAVRADPQLATASRRACPRAARRSTDQG